MTSRVVITRLPTGVHGLDRVLGGGLPEFSFNLIAGPPGCGKTTLAHQLMFGLSASRRRALYFTVLGEPPLKMLRHQQQYDFFNEADINRTIRFADLTDEAMGGDLDKLLARISEEVAAYGPELVFVDAFRSLPGADAAYQGDLQRFMQRLSLLMTSWKATTFIIGEYLDDTTSNPVFTIADGTLRLHQSVLRNSMVRKLDVLKMRGQATLPGLHSFRISSSGITVFAPAIVPQMTDTADVPLEASASVGVAELDSMLGHGLPRGYSLLVAGPSGSGKTILASAFLIEGIRRGEPGVLAAFEQLPSRARDPLLLDAIERGDVCLVDSRMPNLSIDEIVMKLVEEIRRRKARRVVIDSLSGFELSLAPTFREDFRESMARLVSSVLAEGVTMLMTSELEDRYTDLRFSPYGTAFLTDAIVVMRYIEVESRLRRVLAVVKVRASRHSDEVREFTIDGEGIHIGAPLREYEGLLAGSPSRYAAVGPSEDHPPRV
jgi:circadian clock protein KaiC